MVHAIEDWFTSKNNYANSAKKSCKQLDALTGKHIKVVE